VLLRSVRSFNNVRARDVEHRQPILALLFGRLADDFVNFATTVELFKSGIASPDELAAAGRSFRQSANKNALFFVYAGTYCSILFGCVVILKAFNRHRCVVRDLDLHVYLVLHF
jgi:hypothetical protein